MRTAFDLSQLSASAVRSPMDALGRPSFKVIIRTTTPSWDRTSRGATRALPEFKCTGSPRAQSSSIVPKHLDWVSPGGAHGGYPTSKQSYADKTDRHGCEGERIVYRNLVQHAGQQSAESDGAQYTSNQSWQND